MPLFTTGAGPQRDIRSSRFVFDWTPGLGSLDALTGHIGTFTSPVQGTVGTVSGRNGVSVATGHGQPRFDQPTTQGTVTRLHIQGTIGGQDQERLSWPWSLKVMALSLYLKVYADHTPGQTVSAQHAVNLGDGTGGGGDLYLERNGVQWRAVRRRAAATIVSSFTEPAGAVFPMELLATLTTGGALTLYSRDAAGVLRDGSTATDANMMIATESWAGGALFIGALILSAGIGGDFRFERIRIARGIKTMSEMAP